MDDRGTRRYETFERVDNFGTDNAADFDPAGATTDHHYRFAGKHAQFTASVASQANGSVEERVDLVHALRHDTADIHTLIHDCMIENNFLDATVRNKYRLNHGKFAARENASDIGCASKRRNTAADFADAAASRKYSQIASENGRRAHTIDPGLWKSTGPGINATCYAIVPAAAVHPPISSAPNLSPTPAAPTTPSSTTPPPAARFRKQSRRMSGRFFRLTPDRRPLRAGFAAA